MQLPRPSLARPRGLSLLAALASAPPRTMASVDTQVAPAQEVLEPSRPPSIDRSSQLSSRTTPRSMPPSCPTSRPASPAPEAVASPRVYEHSRRPRPPSPTSARMPSPVSSSTRDCTDMDHNFLAEPVVDRSSSPPPGTAPMLQPRLQIFHRRKKRSKARKKHAATSADDELDLTAAWVLSVGHPSAPKGYPCEHCGKVFPPATIKGKHPMWHVNGHRGICLKNPDRGFPCAFCDSEFYTEARRDEHQSTCRRRKLGQ